jgi:hypothetical protein
VRAPVVPGGYAGRCFATLLERACAGLTDMPFGDPEEAPARRRAARDDLCALAALYRHESHFYPEAAIRPGDGLPMNGGLMRAAMAPQRGSSPASACVEAAHG